jgi:predicted membrane chloride channel (bestrophin family)
LADDYVPKYLHHRVAAFAWLGLESTAVEVESPFGKDRDNALNMDGYIIALLATIVMQLESQKTRETKRVSVTLSP